MKVLYLILVVLSRVVLGVIAWALTLYKLLQLRLALGMPVTGMAVILAAVIVVTAASALLYETPTMQRISRQG